MDANQLTRLYIHTWNRTDPQLRKERAARLFAPDAHYIDLLTDVIGVNAISALIDQVQTQVGGASYRSTGDADGYHQQVRLARELGWDEQVPGPVGGSDVVIVDGGRIELVLGFLDRVPA